MNMRAIFIACRVLLGVVFLVACAHKILFPADFALSVFRYQILPAPLINMTAITLPWMELVAAVLIVFSVRFKDAAAVLFLAMLTVFTAAIIFNLMRGLDVACGCFTTSADADPMGWGNVFRNLGYMFLALVVLNEQRIAAMLSLPPIRR